MTAPNRTRRRRDALVLGALLFVHAWLALASSRSQSLTIDEHIYIAAGMAHLQRVDDRLAPEQPPLAKLMAGLPALVERPRWDEEDPDWRLAGEWRKEIATSGLTPENWERVTRSLRAEWAFSVRFLYEVNRDKLERWLAWLRPPLVFVSCLTGLVIFLWARWLWGSLAAAVALALWSASPSALAHAGLATTDTLFTFFHTAALYHLLRLLREPDRRRWRRCAFLGVALLGALMSKHSGLLLVGIAGVACAAFTLRDSDRRVYLRQVGPPLALAVGAAGLAVPLLAIAWFGRSYYLAGVEFVLTRLIANERPYYLAGAVSERFPHYFVVTALLKTSLPALVAVLASVVVALRTGAWKRAELLYGWSLAGGLLALCSLRYPNLGVRYLLPLYPLAFLGAGWLAAQAVGRARIAVGLLVAAHLVTGALAFPGYLSWVNVLGAPRGAGYWFDDSNLDWGQDLPALATWCREAKVERVYLLQYGIAEPTFYGVPAEEISAKHLWHLAPGSCVALSVTYLQREPDIRRLASGWKRLIVLNETLYVFAVPSE